VVTPDDQVIAQRIRNISRSAGTVCFLLSEAGHPLASNSAEVLESLVERGLGSK